MADYPIVKVPQRFLQINKTVPPLPTVSEAPVEPIEPVEPELPKLLAVQNNFASRGCLSSIISWAVGMAIIILGNHPIATGVVIIFVLFAVIRPLRSSSKSAVESNAMKQRVYEKYFTKYKEDKKHFDNNKANYLAKNNKHEAEKRDYNLSIEKRDKNTDYEWDILKFREKLLDKALSQSAIPVLFEGKQYKTGISEDLFFGALVDFFFAHDYYAPLPISRNNIPVIPQGKFEAKILRQHTVPDKNMEWPLMPDFILSIASTKQSVVIEIDEPYVGSDGTPIHYINSKDDYRDRYFLANGWIVIRFAEEQIVKHPFECCWFIANTLLQNTPSFEIGSIQNKMMPYWDEIDLMRIPQWTEKGASRMAFARYRNTYLPSHLAAKIKEEEYSPLKSVNIEIRTAFNSEDFDKREAIQRLIDEEEGNNHLPF